MKESKELALELLKHPEFDIEFSIFERDGSAYGAGVRSWNITGIGDIGYSDKIILLSGMENN